MPEEEKKENPFDNLLPEQEYPTLEVKETPKIASLPYPDVKKMTKELDAVKIKLEALEKNYEKLLNDCFLMSKGIVHEEIQIEQKKLNEKLFDNILFKMGRYILIKIKKKKVEKDGKKI